MAAADQEAPRYSSYPKCMSADCWLATIGGSSVTPHCATRGVALTPDKVEMVPGEVDAGSRSGEIARLEFVTKTRGSIHTGDKKIRDRRLTTGEANEVEKRISRALPIFTWPKL
ncbi:hypothetical protein VTL71DRAFT_3741 [Oculimacula yallundae]|uniref:Uncharacterized protein n=1 Tax=Oculimacula yallundae TaxID=86028 RepID=A0ABR4C3W4_9HELO